MPSPRYDVLNLMHVNVSLPVDLRLTSNFVIDHLTFRSDSGHTESAQMEDIVDVNRSHDNTDPMMYG